jgi:hypothetical protein
VKVLIYCSVSSQYRLYCTLLCELHNYSRSLTVPALYYDAVESTMSMTCCGHVAFASSIFCHNTVCIIDEVDLMFSSTINLFDHKQAITQTKNKRFLVQASNMVFPARALLLVIGMAPMIPTAMSRRVPYCCPYDPGHTYYGHCQGCDHIEHSGFIPTVATCRNWLFFNYPGGDIGPGYGPSCSASVQKIKGGGIGR